MKSYPLVNVLIPTYNVEKTIKKTLLSILNQSYKNFIVYIVDNNSSDKTISIIKSIKNKKIKLFKYRKKVVAEENFNRCIKLSKGKYTAIFHSDDIYDSEIIYKQICFLEKNKKAGAVFSDGYLIDQNDNLIAPATSPLYAKNDNFNYTYEQIFEELSINYNFLLCPTAMVRTPIYKNEIKRFRYDLFGNSSDLDAWLRIAKKHSIGIIRQKLINYRISPTQQTTVTRKDTNLPDFFKVIDYYIKDKKIKNKNQIKKNYTILKTYFYLFLFISASKKKNKNFERKWFKKFLIYKKKISYYTTFSQKKFNIELIYLALKFTKYFNFFHKRLIKYLYLKFYKV